jgi:DNA-binding CsgD family transcriptional regulator
MYLKWTSEFSKFLGDQDHTIEEVLGHLVLSVMAPLEATSAFIAKLNNQNLIETIGRFGITDQLSSEYETSFVLSDRLPITDAIRLRKLIVINSLPNWPKEYAEILGTPYHSEEKALFAFPIERSGTPIAVAAVFFKSKITINADIELFIGAIANLLSLYLRPHIDHSGPLAKSRRDFHSIEGSEQGLALTQRQQLILRMISEGRTNIAIGDLLKYSESTIRQETIRIFSKLDCDGRDEASKLYKIQQLKVQAAG